MKALRLQSAFLVIFILMSCVNDNDEADTAVSMVGVGDTVPAFSLFGSDGSSASSSSLMGQTYILNFFDTSCSDCQKELQVLQRIHSKYGAKVPVLNVPRSQTKQEVSSYWQQTGLSMPFHESGDQRLYYKFATKIIPRTYVVDGSGKVVAAFSDKPVADFDTLDALLQQMVGDAAPADGEVRLSFRIRVPSLGSDIEEYYFHNEYTISRLEVWFFDADTKKYVTKGILTGLTKEETLYDAKYDITYLCEDIGIKTGLYDIFIIANYDHSPEKVAEESEFLDLIDDKTYRTGIEANMPDNGPVMTNRATSLLAVDLRPWANKHYVLEMELERVMAKLQIGVLKNSFSLEYNQRKYAEINITNYKLVNMNRCYYLFQHKDVMSEFKEKPVFTMPDNFTEYVDDGDEYVVDPHFYEKTTNSSDLVKSGSYYNSWFGDFTTEGFASMPSADNYGYAYILENTSFKTCQKNGYSPGIVFKAAVSPVFVYLYDSSRMDLKEEYRPEYWPRTLYLYKYNFYGSLHAVNIASGLSLDELVTYTDAQLKTYGIKQCKFNMGAYETYYTYWIRHRLSISDTMGPMVYGIVRNTYYKMLVTGISGLGNSVITPDIARDNYPNTYTDIVIN